MPALSNPRHEAFAQAIFAGLSGKTRIDRAQSTAYLTAYPNCSPGNSAEVNASRLLRRAKPILDRVRELQAQANARLQPKLDISRERIARNLDEASRMAKEQENPANIVAAELGIAKVFGLTKHDDNYNPTDLRNAQTSKDLGRLLLISVGLSAPSEADILAAVEANDRFVETLERIRDNAQEFPIASPTDSDKRKHN